MIPTDPQIGLRRLPAERSTHRIGARSRRCVLLSAIILAVGATFPTMIGTAQQTNPCDPFLNAIACENSKPGSPQSEWDLDIDHSQGRYGYGDPAIQGFATELSVNRGTTVSFKIASDGEYKVDIYRLGYYAGAGARLRASSNPEPGTDVTTVIITSSTPQPLCGNQEFVDCANWAVSAIWEVPTDAVSGVYIARLTRMERSDPLLASHIVFVVRDDAGHSDVVFQTSDTTWQAYNEWNGDFSCVTGGRDYPGACGKGLYGFDIASYNRPFATREAYRSMNFVFDAEYPMIRFLEANGYDVSYITAADTERCPDALCAQQLGDHRVFLSVGHDEYWSTGQRLKVQAARDATPPTHLVFFSGNQIFWKSRWADSTYKVLIARKEAAASEPYCSAEAWTGMWRDSRCPAAAGSEEARARLPENELTGSLFAVEFGPEKSIHLPVPHQQFRFWRHTTSSASVKVLAPGSLSFEYNEDRANGFRPPGLIHLTSTTVQLEPSLDPDGGRYLISDFGPPPGQGELLYSAGTATHAVTAYKTPNGAWVYNSGTIRWSWGLDAIHDNNQSCSSACTSSPEMRQFTVNMFADMGVQPATLESNLTPAVASADTTGPNVSVNVPPVFAADRCGPVTVEGTAADSEGRVAAVEVSIDGGEWQRANGFETWSYQWVPRSGRLFTVIARAVDDSGNIGSESSSVTILLTGGTQGCNTSFNGDGQPDVFTYDSSTGVGNLRVGDSGAFSSSPIQWSSGWRVFGADFNGDGLTDILFYNKITGHMVKGVSNGATDFTYYEDQWGPDWSVTVLDLNADGLSDIFLYNAQAGDWKKRFTLKSNPSGPFDHYVDSWTWSPGWQVFPARLNSDLRDDILLYNPDSGVWFRCLNLSDTAGFEYYSGLWEPGMTLVVSDFDADGLSDVFRYDVSSGAWMMVLTTFGWSSGVPGAWSAGWTLRAGDFNGDALNDLFLYNQLSGQWFQAVHDGWGGFSYATGWWDPGWEVSVVSLNGDANADVFVYNPGDGRWVAATNQGVGLFGFGLGTWEPGLQTILNIPKLP